MLHLESIDLSSNNLTGEIPQQLASLTFLSFLNLSDNMLSGSIPTGTQLQSFSKDSFDGNTGLCGLPLPISCLATPPAGQSGVNFSDKNTGYDWEFIVPGMGFGLGAGTVVATLLFWKKANNWCDDHIDKILTILLPMLGLVYYTKNDWRIAPEESFEEKANDVDDDNDEDDDDEDDVLRGRYCVFCTKLDITRKRAIHGLKCICYDSPPTSSSTSSSLSSSASL